MHSKHFNRVISASLSALMALGSITPAMASTSIFNLEVEIDDEPSLVSVQVPAVINMKFKIDGTVEVPSDLSIINLDQNNSVKLVELSVEGQNGWSVKDYSLDLNNLDTDTKQLSMQFNGDKTQDGGEVALTESNWTIEAQESLPLTVDVKMPKQTAANEGQIAKANWTFAIIDELTCSECGTEVQSANQHKLECGHYSCANDGLTHTPASCGINGHYNCDNGTHGTCSICGELECEGEHGQGVCEAPAYTTLTVDYDNGLMLPGSTNSAKFNWTTNVVGNKLVSVTSSNPDVAEAQAISSLATGEETNGEQQVAITAKTRGTAIITGTLESGETSTFTVEVSELQNDTGSGEDAPSGEVEGSDGLKSGDTVKPEDITVTIPVVNPDGSEGEIEVTPDSITGGSLTEGENTITATVNVNGMTINITIVINIASSNPSNGLIQTVPEAQAAGWTFAVYEEGLQVTGFENVNFQANINVPEQIGDFKVLSIGDNVFKNQTNLKSITVPDTVKSIGDNTFSGCTNLASIDLGNGLLSIGSSAIAECTSLKSIDIPGSIETWGESVFSGCTGLENVRFKDGLSSIGSKAFSGCSKLDNVTIIGSIKSISEEAFTGCTGLSNLRFEEGVTVINTKVFNGCTSLTNVKLPDTLITVGGQSFIDCTALESVTFGKSVEVIGKSSFSGCVKLKSVDIPDSVTKINNQAFENCSELSNVTLGSGLKTLNTKAFRNTNLSKLEIPEGVETIGGYIVQGANVDYLFIPKSVKTLSDYACTGVSTIDVENTYANEPCLIKAGISPGIARGVSSGSTVRLVYGDKSIEIPTYAAKDNKIVQGKDFGFAYHFNVAPPENMGVLNTPYYDNGVKITSYPIWTAIKFSSGTYPLLYKDIDYSYSGTYSGYKINKTTTDIYEVYYDCNYAFYTAKDPGLFNVIVHFQDGTYLNCINIEGYTVKPYSYGSSNLPITDKWGDVPDTHCCYWPSGGDWWGMPAADLNTAVRNTEGKSKFYPKEKINNGNGNGANHEGHLAYFYKDTVNKIITLATTSSMGNYQCWGPGYWG